MSFDPRLPRATRAPDFGLAIPCVTVENLASRSGVRTALARSTKGGWHRRGGEFILLLEYNVLLPVQFNYEIQDAMATT